MIIVLVVVGMVVIVVVVVLVPKRDGGCHNLGRTCAETGQGGVQGRFITGWNGRQNGNERGKGSCRNMVDTYYHPKGLPKVINI